MEMELSFGEKVLLNIFRVLTTVLGAIPTHNTCLLSAVSDLK